MEETKRKVTTRESRINRVLKVSENAKNIMDTCEQILLAMRENRDDDAEAGIGHMNAEIDMMMKNSFDI